MNKTDSGIYGINNLVNHKSYIGSSVNVQARMRRHLRLLLKNKHDNNHLQRAFNKYGEENFEFKIIEFCKQDKLLEREQYFIDVNRVCETGYNISPTAGSLLGLKCSDEHKRRISESHKGKICSVETKGKLSNINKGKYPSMETRLKMSQNSVGMRGKKHTTETKDKISRNHGMRGKTHTPEAKSKISAAMKNRVISIETRRKLSLINSGENHPMFGKHLSPETRQKMSESHKRGYRVEGIL